MTTTDTEKPKRVRGQKEREAAYRQGFLDGLTHAKAELASQRALEAERDEAMRDGLTKLRATPVVKRTRRMKIDKRDLDSIPAAGPEHRGIG